MKKLLSLILALCLLMLCGCAGEPVETEPSTEETTEATTEATTEPTTEPTEETTEPTTEPTEPEVLRNPLTGEVVEEAVDTRVFAVTINNIPGAMPHFGVHEADLYFEMFVNSYATRGLALYSDISKVRAVGSVRSLRFNFTDICQAFDAVVVHAGGSDMVLNDLYGSGVENIAVESTVADYYFRDGDRLNAGYSWEHCLFVWGEKTMDYAEGLGYSVTQDPEKDYGLRFSEEATPADGETANKVVINMKHGPVTKTTNMIYDEASGEYIYNQYGYDMHDGINGQVESFKNVIVMLCNVQDKDIYHVANLIGSGDGYFACNGQIIPIKWYRDGNDDPFHYTLADGTPLEMGVGSSYISIAPLKSEITWE